MTSPPLQLISADCWGRKAALLVIILLLIIATTTFGASSTMVDYLLLEKSKRTLTLYAGEQIIAQYQVALGGNPVGPKQQEGDGKTPEGIYVIDFRKPDSAFHLSLHISYPNAQDQRQAKARGVAPGGSIFIHGLKNGLGWIGAAHRKVDWTNGCIAVTNEEIEEIWRLVPDRVKIEILP